MSHISFHADRKPASSMCCDPFDSLPDSIVLYIFNKVLDVKALGRCSGVSRRFHLLIPHVEDVVVKVDCVISTERLHECTKGKGLLARVHHLLFRSIAKSLQFLQHFLTPKKSIVPEVSQRSPGEVIRNFKGIKRLKIELPGGELDVEEGAILKWRAEFGSTLESCEILAASSLINFDKQSVNPNTAPRGITSLNSTQSRSELAEGVQETNENLPENFSTNGGLKLRVVWTISSLIAASARHHLLQQIIFEHPALESLVLADGHGQGTLSMSRKQLSDFRDKPILTSSSSNRTQVPALNIKLWYAPFLVLPGGAGMRGATLVAIRPNHELMKGGMDALPPNAFEGPFKTAANSLVRGQTYLLEMNSF